MSLNAKTLILVSYTEISQELLEELAVHIQ